MSDEGWKDLANAIILPVVMEYNADGTAEFGYFIPGHFSKIFSVHLDNAGSCPFLAKHKLNQRAFARSGRADYEYKFTVGYAKAYVVKR